MSQQPLLQHMPHMLRLCGMMMGAPHNARGVCCVVCLTMQSLSYMYLSTPPLSTPNLGPAHPRFIAFWRPPGFHAACLEPEIGQCLYSVVRALLISVPADFS